MSEKNPLEKLAEDLAHETFREDHALIEVQESIDAVLKQMSEVESAADVVKLIARLSALGMGLGTLLVDLETRLAFIESQTIDATYKQVVKSAKNNVIFVRKHGRPPEPDEVGQSVADPSQN